MGARALASSSVSTISTISTDSAVRAAPAAGGERSGAVLDALGDPTRRRVLELVRSAPCSVTELAAQLPVSRPAVSQHLRVLFGAGLVEVQPSGRQRLYRARPAGLEPLARWIEGFWTDIAAAFTAAVDDYERNRT